MPVYDQQVTTYSDTTPHQRVISDVINIISPTDTPLIAALGGISGARSKFKIRENGYKIEILEDEMPQTSDTLAVAMTTSDLSLTVADASIFQPGDVILIDAEYMVVSAVNVTTNVVTVFSRAYGGTNATHAISAVVEKVGMARLEGADATFGHIVDIIAPYNYTSILQAGLNISGTMQKISQHGIADEYEYQSLKQIPYLLTRLEAMMFHGVRNAGSATSPRSMGGLANFITTNSVSVGGAITKEKIDDAMEKAYQNGGQPDLLVLNPGVARDLKDDVDNSNFVRLGYENTQVGMQPIQRVSTQYGQVQIVMSRWCPVSTAFVLQSGKVGLYDFRQFEWKELAMVGDSKRGEVVGEFSMLVANEKAHVKLTGITRWPESQS